MSFALVLTDNLPPETCNLLPGTLDRGGWPVIGTFGVVAAQLLLVAAASLVCSRVTLARFDATAGGLDRTTQTFARGQRILLALIAVALVATMILTPWAPLVRDRWHLGQVPLLGDLVILTPFFASLAIVWTVFFPVDMRLRRAAVALADEETAPPRPDNDAIAALTAAKRDCRRVDNSLATYLADKFRHQVLIIAIPMSMIAFSKYFTDLYKADLTRLTRLPWLSEAFLGAASVCILGFAPLMLRYIWTTEPLPDGPLRDRFIRTCRRIGLRHREILLWHTHGMAINAAVMGFIAPLRYILVSDALLETMDEDDIEAVFGHEAGHVHHWHLQFFVLFALVSMYLAGGAMHLLWAWGVHDLDLLQVLALGVLLLSWLFGFGWLSRRFERQADLYGVRCVTPDVTACARSCPIHGTNPAPGICISAASRFGRTLVRIADLNGIPKDAPSWRHGSIESRCRQIERFTSDAAALNRFDRNLVLIKIGLIVAVAVGTFIAGWLYHKQIFDALRWSLSN